VTASKPGPSKRISAPGQSSDHPRVLDQSPARYRSQLRPVATRPARRSTCSESRVDRLAFEGQDTEDAFVNTEQRLTAHEALERLDAEGELSLSQ